MSVPLIDWAIISSAPEIEEESLRSFFTWLSERMNAVAEANSISLHFATKPSILLFSKTSDFGSVRGCYRELYDQLPHVIAVFHVLPGPDALEYEWMRQFSYEYGVARQGILSQNVASRFESIDCPVDDAVLNMCSWLEERIAQLAHGDSHQRALNLSVTKPNIRSSTRALTAEEMRSGEQIQMSVFSALHRRQSSDFGRTIDRFGPAAQVTPDLRCQLDVTGLSERTTVNDLRSLFGEYNISDVSLGSDPVGAVVTLSSKFEVLQAAEKFDGYKLDDAELVVVPRCPILKSKIAQF